MDCDNRFKRKKEKGSTPLKIERREAFCQHYVATLVPTKAAELAKYSKTSASIQAANLMKDPCVRDRINYLKARAAKKLELSQYRILEEMAKIALFDIRQLYDLDGRYKKVSEIGAREAAAISRIKTKEVIDEEGDLMRIDITDVKTYDKIVMLDKLLEYFKGISDNGGNGSSNGSNGGSLEEEKEVMIIAQLLSNLDTQQLQFFKKEMASKKDKYATRNNDRNRSDN